MKYRAEVINLNGRAVIRVTTAEFGTSVGYFASPEAIHDHGLPVDLADVEVVAVG